jgi:hypothetical protein
VGGAQLLLIPAPKTSSAASLLTCVKHIKHAEIECQNMNIFFQFHLVPYQVGHLCCPKNCKTKRNDRQKQLGVLNFIDIFVHIKF